MLGILINHVIGYLIKSIVDTTSITCKVTIIGSIVGFILGLLTIDSLRLGFYWVIAACAVSVGAATVYFKRRKKT